MSGKQAEFVALGAQNEADAHSLIGRLCAPVKVPREHDFGVDFFCQLYTRAGTKSVTVDDIFTLQVKGMTESLHFGGVRDGRWHDYEIVWLKTLSTPFFLARVEASGPTLDVYSVAPLWRVLWQSGAPFEITCTTEPASQVEHQRTAITWTDSAGPHGDQRSWLVPLGVPFLRLTHADLADRALKEQATARLREHIQLERRNLLLFRLRVAVHECVEKWTTNVGPSALSRAMFWGTSSGENLDELATALEPVALNLGVHLQWQNDKAAYQFIDVLEWLHQKKGLDPLGRGLLEGRKNTRAKGLGPNERALPIP
jgi:hypothetical protein